MSSCPNLRHKRSLISQWQTEASSQTADRKRKRVWQCKEPWVREWKQQIFFSMRKRFQVWLGFCVWCLVEIDRNYVYYLTASFFFSLYLPHLNFFFRKRSVKVFPDEFYRWNGLYSINPMQIRSVFCIVCGNV